MKEGWEAIARVSFMSVAIQQLFGRVLFDRKDIKCRESTFKQLLEHGFIERTDDGRFRVVITEEQFLDARAVLTKEDFGRKKPKGFLAGVTPTEQDIGEFKELIAVKDAITYFAPSIAPKIKEMDKVKAAILIALASHDDENDDRFRVNVLMYGDKSSGTGKTPMLKWLRRLGAAYIDAAFATRAGIAVNLRTGEPGVLAKHHKGVCAIDEIDKMSKVDRDGILEALEDGTVTYASGNDEGFYEAEIVGIAGANSIKNFTPEQRLRFDFRFHVNPYSETQACIIADSISEMMGRPAKEVPQDKLVKFLKWIRERETTGIPDDVRRDGAKEIKAYIKERKNTDIRRIEGVWRVARAIARLNYRDVTLSDVKRAIRLLDEADKTKEGLNEKRRLEHI